MRISSASCVSHGLVATLTSGVEEGRWTGTYWQPVVSLPRSSNRTCPFRASGFPTDFTNQLREGARGAHRGAANTQFPEHDSVREKRTAARLHFMAVSQEIPYALVNVIVRHPCRHIVAVSFPHLGAQRRPPSVKLTHYEGRPFIMR
jgi:hypothetical protein